MKKQIVYILSTNFAGSHLLSHVIGSHSKCMHIGEVKGLVKRTSKKNFCAICESHAVCPLLKNIGPEDAPNIYEKIFTNTGNKFPVLVDTSKKTYWAEKFLKQDRYTLKYIHLVRDPRALVRRWMVTQKKISRDRLRTARLMPESVFATFFGDLVTLYANKWLAQNKQITRFLKNNRLNHKVVTYFDLVKNEKEVLTELMNWIGYPYEPGQEEYWNFEHHGSQKVNYEWVKTEKVKHFDCRWKDYLSPNQQKRIIQDKKILSYMEELGIKFHDSGISIA